MLAFLVISNRPGLSSFVSESLPQGNIVATAYAGGCEIYRCHLGEVSKAVVTLDRPPGCCDGLGGDEITWPLCTATAAHCAAGCSQLRLRTWWP